MKKEKQRIFGHEPGKQAERPLLQILDKENAFYRHSAVSFAPLITVNGIILNRFSVSYMEYLTKPCDFEELVGKGLI